jgi:hypothetical protein
MKDMKKWVKCPECGKRANRIFEITGTQINVQGGTPIYDKRRDHKKDCGVATRWHDDEVRKTEKALDFKTGISPYSKMIPNYSELEKQGVVKKASKEQQKDHKEKATKITKDAVSKLSGAEKDHAVRGSGNSMGPGQ